jgi:membrane protein insertase Oxa1/YidC/SpoIIIJ
MNIMDIHDTILPHLSGTHLSDVHHHLTSSFFISEEQMQQVSTYSKVDKSGFIGFFANIIEQGIDLIHVGLNKVGVEYSYGISIILFTFLIKALTFPLTNSQLESTTKMQKLTPLQQKIQNLV